MQYDAVATGLRIQQLRKSVDMTLEELGERLNITDRQVRQIEKGESNGSIDLLVEVSMTFHVSLDYLIFGKVGDRTDLKKILQQAIGYLSELE